MDAEEGSIKGAQQYDILTAKHHWRRVYFTCE